MLLRFVLLVPWCVFWSFLALTSYCPPVRDWWENDRA